MPCARSTPRPGSPPVRSSILITSAPRSPSITDATGPCCQIVQSTTRIPSRGLVMLRPLAHTAVRSQGVWVVRACMLTTPPDGRIDMHVLLTGATGLIGRPLVRALAAAGHSVTVVSRTPGRAPTRAVGWDGVPGIISEVDAVVNLAGEPVAEGRWTEARKQAIRASRIDGTRVIVQAMRQA